MAWKLATQIIAAADGGWTYPSLPNPLNPIARRRSRSISQSTPTHEMARCPFCNRVLADAWVKKAGSTLMGKTGKRKARSSEIASAAANARWTVHRELSAAKEEIALLREQVKKRAKRFPT